MTTRNTHRANLRHISKLTDNANDITAKRMLNRTYKLICKQLTDIRGSKKNKVTI